MADQYDEMAREFVTRENDFYNIDELGAVIRAAVEAERKRCIDIVDGFTGQPTEMVVTAIRSGLPVA